MIEKSLVILVSLSSVFMLGCHSSKSEVPYSFRVNCGADQDFIDVKGNVWHKDQAYTKGSWGYSGGQKAERGALQIDNTANVKLFLNERYEEYEFDYQFPVTNGKYMVKFYFAETYDGISDAGQRVFSIDLEGKQAFMDIDPLKLSSYHYNVITKTSEVEVKDGLLSISLIPNIQNPMINAIEIIQLENY